jgi:hypothetical protein
VKALARKADLIGNSCHPGLVAQCFNEQICRIPCQVKVASDYRYRNTVAHNTNLFEKLKSNLLERARPRRRPVRGCRSGLRR